MPRYPSARRHLAIAGVLAVATLVAGILVRPAVPEPDRPLSGDPVLRQVVDQRYDGPRHRLAVALIDLGDERAPVRYVGFGSDEHGEFEIGSVSKGLTGLLLAEAVARREVRLDQPVGELLPLADSPVAAVTLEELAAHRSGLPRLAPAAGPLARGLYARLSGGNPYPYDVAALLEHARAAGIDGRGEPTYSNLGGALLGQALARAARTDYPQLLRARVLGPLGLTGTRVSTSKTDAAPKGFSTGGRRQDPWPQDGYGPAGGVVSTAADLARMARALLGGTGATALAPRHDFGDGKRIGLHWLTSPLPGTDRTMVWHNGGTGGYRAFVGLDPQRRRAVVVLSDVAADVDRLAADLLREV